MNIQAKEAKGYYITLNNDTVHVTFKIPYNPFVSLGPNLSKMQYSIEYYVNKKEKQDLFPIDILAYTFYYINDEYETDTFNFISKKNNLALIDNSLFNFKDDSVLFLRLILKGKLSLYKYYYIGSTSVGAGPNMNSANVITTLDILEKTNETLFKYNSFKFKSEMSEYLSDCPIISKSIAEKKYKPKHILDIVTEYNRICGN